MPPTNIRQVCKGRFQILFVLLVHRQLPGLFARSARCCHKLSQKRFVVRESAHVVVAERDANGARQCGRVHNVSGAVALRIGDGIRQDQPAFGIGVQNFNRFAGKRRNNVPWPLRIAIEEGVSMA